MREQERIWVLHRAVTNHINVQHAKEGWLFITTHSLSYQMLKKYVDNILNYIKYELHTLCVNHTDREKERERECVCV